MADDDLRAQLVDGGLLDPAEGVSARPRLGVGAAHGAARRKTNRRVDCPPSTDGNRAGGPHAGDVERARVAGLEPRSSGSCLVGGVERVTGDHRAATASSAAGAGELHDGRLAQVRAQRPLSRCRQRLLDAARVAVDPRVDVFREVVVERVVAVAYLVVVAAVVERAWVFHTLAPWGARWWPRRWAGSGSWC